MRVNANRGLIQTCLLGALLAPPALAQVQFNYTTNNGTITITGYTGSGGAMTILATLNRLPVASIGDDAFRTCDNLTNVMIGNSVTSIGDYAFSGCTRVKSFTIPNSVTSIGDEAFEECSGLANITIPNSVTSIGGRVFGDCSSLFNITIPNIGPTFL